jgi:hypothetical protein
MKKTLLIAILAAVGLSGCVAVPVYDGGYAGPAYGYYAAPPAASISFGYYHHGGHRHHHHRRHHRHWH